MHAYFYVYMTTGTVVLIRLHKKADLIDMKVNCRKDGKAHVDNIALIWEKIYAINQVVWAVD